MDRYQELVRRLRAFRLRTKLVRMFETGCQFFTIELLVFAFLPIVFLVGSRDTIFRLLVTTAITGGFVYLGFRFILRPLADLLIFRQYPGVDKVALTVGRQFPDVQDRLCNAMQVVEQLSGLHGESSALAWAAFHQMDEQTRALDFNKAVSVQKAKKNFWQFLSAAFILAMGYLLFPGSYSKAFTLFINPTKTNLDQEFVITVTPGDVEVIRGEKLHIRVNISADAVREAELVVQYDNGEVSESLPLVREAQHEFAYEFENVNDPFKYHVLSDRMQSPSYRVSVVDLPDIRELQLTLHPPGYSRQPERKLDPNIGSANVLVGTGIDFSVLPNKPVNAAKIYFGTGDSLVLEPAGDHFKTRVPVRREFDYSIGLLDKKGLRNEHPIVYAIRVTPDQNPMVEIQFPGKDVDIDERMQIPLAIGGEDDFGFSKLQVSYEIYRGGIATSGQSSRFDLPYTVHDNKLQASFMWNLTEMSLLPEDVVVYRAEVFDNDVVSGPKSARSADYRLRFPSAEEIFAESAREQGEATTTVNELLEQSKAIKSDIDKVLQDIRRDRDLGWEEKQKLKESLGKQEQVLNEMEQVKQKVDEMVDRLQRNDLVTAETLQKYQELQKLMEEIASPEIKKLMEKLQEAMNKVNPEDIRKALEEYQFSQEELLKSLDKTINMLKQLQAEQKLDEAIKRTAEMLQRQEEINKAAAEQKAQQDKDSYNNLAGKQNAQQESLDALQKNLDELQSKTSEIPEMKLPQDKIEQAQDIAQSEMLSSSIQQASKQLQQGKMQQAQNSGQNISESLQQMQNLLSEAQQQMQQDQRKEVMQALQRSSKDLLELSKRQEQLGQKAQRQSQATTNFRESADEQQDILSAMQRVTEQLFQQAQKSFFVPPEIAKKLGQSMNNMQQAVGELENQRGQQAANTQGQAMQGLNGAVAELRKAMKSLSGGSQGSGMEQFMQRLLGMSGEQQGINQQTQKLSESGQMSLSQQASLSRLAARQEALRKSLEDLLREAGGRSEIQGGLQKAAEDMGDVVREMQRQNVSQNTIQRQERILSRLLDAQRSTNERDFSNKRQAETGKAYQNLDPGALPANLGQAKSKIQQDLLRALQENYSKDYKELIQKYFEALAKETQNDGKN